MVTCCSISCWLVVMQVMTGHQQLLVFSQKPARNPFWFTLGFRCFNISPPLTGTSIAFELTSEPSLRAGLRISRSGVNGMNLSRERIRLNNLRRAAPLTYASTAITIKQSRYIKTFKPKKCRNKSMEK